MFVKIFFGPEQMAAGFLGFLPQMSHRFVSALTVCGSFTFFSRGTDILIAGWMKRLETKSRHWAGVDASGRHTLRRRLARLGM